MPKVGKKVVITVASILVLTVAVSLGVMFAVTRGAIDSLSRPPVSDAEPEFADIKAGGSPASTWLRTFLNTAPEGTHYKVNEFSKELNFNIQSCAYISDTRPSDKLLQLGDAGPEGVTPVVMAAFYSPGFGRTEYESVLEKLTQCSVAYSESSSGSVSYALFSGGGVLTAGDAVVTVRADSENERDSLVSFYAKTLESTLTDSQCSALSETNSDFTRNVFFDTYKQYTVGASVETNVTLDGLLRVTGVPKAVNAPARVSKPEGPYPKDFPESLPSKPSDKPEALQEPSSFKGKKDFTVPAVDTDGPGCGWRWAGLTNPVFNEKETSERAESEKLKQQLALDTENIAAKREAVVFQTSLADRIKLVYEWNKYVTELNKVYSQWSALNKARTEYRPAWSSYIKSWDDYVTAVNAYNKNVASYTDSMKKCYVTELRKQQPASEAVLIQTCHEKTPPLAEFSGKPPQEPTAPENMTVPDSWPKPPTPPELSKYNDSSVLADARKEVEAHNTPQPDSGAQSR